MCCYFFLTFTENLTETLIIGTTEDTGCGKTTVVNRTIKEFSGEGAAIISQDSCYRDLSHLSFEKRTRNNFDHPNSIDFELLRQHLLKLRAGETIQNPTYSFIEYSHTRGTVLVRPARVVIIGGILISSHPDIHSLFGIKISVHADSDERPIRRIRCDTTERDHDVNEVLSRYQTTLKPMHLELIKPAKGFTDVIIPNNRRNTVAINTIRTVVHDRIFQ